MDAPSAGRFARLYTMGLCCPNNLTAGAMSPTFPREGFLFPLLKEVMIFFLLAFSMSLLGILTTVLFTHWAHNQAIATINVTQSVQVLAMQLWMPYFGRFFQYASLLCETPYHTGVTCQEYHPALREELGISSHFAHPFQVLYLSVAGNCLPMQFVSFLQ